MNNSKQIITTGLLLMLFAIIGSGLVGTTYEGTKKQIAENERRAMLRTLNNILPANTYDNDLINETINLYPDSRLGQTETSTAYQAKKDKIVTAVILPAIAPDGYAGAIKLLVGIRADGTLAGVRVISHKETPGLGDAIETKRSNWILGFNNMSLDSHDLHGWKVKRDGGQFDQLTGATITPRAIVKAVHQSLIYFKHNKQKLLNSTADE
ncbi:MAG: electron transport complex subunit RsxG [Gammaproteobacteria bacterium]|nr:electron transport complex subunit RsxG [Gammaproteobacteria bacterium]MCW8911261.1 electron transport complex subunit RsxG [Gammaproteobacteria bacterium]MCW9006221.1 electron transport complex subunit RsxG [Gammaproteobacteria bacterium]MCW9055861.1 electron transport complex subunit RsxG [Gammaproteobacteria bacterium]